MRVYMSACVCTVLRKEMKCAYERSCTTRENPSSSAGFDVISSAGSRATTTALQLIVSSSDV